MSRPLFDPALRAMRRDRAARDGGDRFLLARAFDDVIDRVRALTRPIETALLVGCALKEWAETLRAIAPDVQIVDPGPLFARAADGVCADEAHYDYGRERFDLCVAVGTLDTVDALPSTLQRIRASLRPDAPLIGALAGGDSLRSLRSALLTADRAHERAVARAHPRIEAASLAGLLGKAGLVMPVVDVDRVTLRYRRLDDLVRDLRAHAATCQMMGPRPPLTRDDWHRSRDAYAALGDGERTPERIDILHFIGWAPSRQATG